MVNDQNLRLNTSGGFGPGHRIGRYEICSRLATGGMATVYLARIEGPGGFKKIVALKCIHPHLVAEPGFVEMFLDEARLASRISHPHVSEVFDFGFADGSYFMAMPLLQGESVALVAKTLHPFAKGNESTFGHCMGHAIRIIADTAMGLHAIHESRDDDGNSLGAVHRDVSPGNLIVTYEGSVKVLDLGIARVVDQLHHTRTGTLKGTLAYMSPEQMSMAIVDRRADIWSLGVVAWELFHGRRLFAKTTEVQTMRAVLEEEIPSLRVSLPGVNKDLCELIESCLIRDPALRPSTAKEVAQVCLATAASHGWNTQVEELGAWMRAQFGARLQRQREQVEAARSLGSTSAASASATLAASDSVASTRALPSRSRGLWWKAGAAVIAVAAPLGVWKWPQESTNSDPPKAYRAAAVTQSSPRQEQPTPMAVPPLPAVNHPPTHEKAPLPTLRRTPHAAQVMMGYVNIATPGGWADVYAAERHLGRTPLQVRLPVGPTRLTLRPFGGAALQKKTTVRADETVRLVVPLLAP
ncbi:MAG: serine/threonine-protein kinase [Deltaproteobacteria bacterium]|nr:serine/threonine-protein kinase [Deltaproteobacteria bacterium]